MGGGGRIFLFWRNFDQGTLATRRGDSKVIHSQRGGDHLYNLTDDLAETSNLIDKEHEQFKQQKMEVKAWEKELIDPIFRPLKVFNKKAIKTNSFK